MGSGMLLKNAILKYGVHNFSKTIIQDDIESIQELNEREIFWIESYKPMDKKIGYNLAPGGEGNTGKWNGDNLSDSHRLKISNAMKGRTIHWKNELSQSRKSSQKVKDVYNDPDWKKKISDSLRGIKKSKDHVSNLKKALNESSSFKRSRSSASFKEKCSNWQKGKTRSDEYMEKWLETKKLNTIKRQEQDKIKLLDCLQASKWDLEVCSTILNITVKTIKIKINKYNLQNERDLD